ncbi:hypothetical protein PUN28_019875 [Cardiocondyla obscurior]|uniref:Uncharacterized protein n=1 Tax=Cardiocondyla obscurior TaxID=286306 RepID=A0AAW2EBU8_9HYME
MHPWVHRFAFVYANERGLEKGEEAGADRQRLNDSRRIWRPVKTNIDFTIERVYKQIGADRKKDEHGRGLMAVIISTALFTSKALTFHFMFLKFIIIITRRLQIIQIFIEHPAYRSQSCRRGERDYFSNRAAEPGCRRELVMTRVPQHIQGVPNTRGFSPHAPR